MPLDTPTLMPRRDEVHPDFDGHLDLPLAKMTPEQRLDWIWQGMQLQRLRAHMVPRREWERGRDERRTRPPHEAR